MRHAVLLPLNETAFLAFGGDKLRKKINYIRLDFDIRLYVLLLYQLVVGLYTVSRSDRSNRDFTTLFFERTTPLRQYFFSDCLIFSKWNT